jgi:hypothetical protein
MISGGCRAELDDATASDQIFLSRQIEIWVNDPAIDHERDAKLHAGACEQRFGGLRADVQGQHRIAGLGVTIHPCPGIGQAADRADPGFPGVEQVTELSAREVFPSGFEVMMSTTPGRVLRKFCQPNVASPCAKKCASTHAP